MRQYLKMNRVLHNIVICKLMRLHRPTHNLFNVLMEVSKVTHKYTSICGYDYLFLFCHVNTPPFQEILPRTVWHMPRW